MAKTLVKIAYFKDLDRFGGAPKASFRREEKNIRCVNGKGYLEIIRVIVKVGSCDGETDIRKIGDMGVRKTLGFSQTPYPQEREILMASLNPQSPVKIWFCTISWV